MIVPFFDATTGTAVYLNPSYVLTVRPDPADPDHVSVVKIQDGESFRLRGDHQQVAKQLGMPSA
jgi:hypothetical protein